MSVSCGIATDARVGAYTVSRPRSLYMRRQFFKVKRLAAADSLQVLLDNVDTTGEAEKPKKKQPQAGGKGGGKDKGKKHN